MEAAFEGTGTAAGFVTAAAATAEAEGAADAARLSPASVSASAAASDEPRTATGLAQPTHRASEASVGSLGMSTMDLLDQLGPPTPELPGTASLGQLPLQMMATTAGTSSTTTASEEDGQGQGTAKRQRIDFHQHHQKASTSHASSTTAAAASSGGGSKNNTKSAMASAEAKALITKALSTNAATQQVLIHTPRTSDVLFGRGGGTNTHAGNRLFRDLINAHRRDYLKARKNDKPAITQRILEMVKEGHGGRFLKKAPFSAGGGSNKKKGDGEGSVVGTGWHEVADSSAREKISQALRQRAPELKKLIYKDQFGTEEIDYGSGNVVPVIFHPNPAENAYLRSLSVGLFDGGTDGVGQSHRAVVEEAAKRRRMQEEGVSGGQLDYTAYVSQHGLGGGDTFTVPLNDSHTLAPQQLGDSSAGTRTLAAGGGHPTLQGDLAHRMKEQERKLKMIEIQRLQLQKQQLELQIAQQQQLNKASFAALQSATMDTYAPLGGVGGLYPTAAGVGLPFMGDGTTDNAQLGQNESAEGATPPSSLLPAKAGVGSADGSPQIVLAPVDGSGGTTPQYNPFGSMQA